METNSSSCSVVFNGSFHPPLLHCCLLTANSSSVCFRSRLIVTAPLLLGWSSALYRVEHRWKVKNDEFVCLCKAIQSPLGVNTNSVEKKQTPRPHVQVTTPILIFFLPLSSRKYLFFYHMTSRGKSLQKQNGFWHFHNPKKQNIKKFEFKCIYKGEKRYINIWNKTLTSKK